MGKLYTFTSVFEEPIPLRKGKEETISRIVIPRIQRPYAQGRTDSESTRVRKDFLNSIFDVLRGEKEKLDLNFVYGKVEKKGGMSDIRENEKWIMEMLDGQQRFTTLFLLNWYILNREAVPDEETRKILTALKAFAYETRDDATRFCRLLSESTLGLASLEDVWDDKHNRNTATSHAIRSMLSFNHSFDEDPTVTAMLVMLDDIHVKYGELFASESNPECWRRLGQIQFRIISLTEYKLSEELYIKMNARGLPLTPFECFKADFLALMDLETVKPRTQRMADRKSGRKAEVGDAEAVTFKQYFAIQLDTHWCNLFWNPKQPTKLDFSYMKFFSRFFSARFLLEHYAKGDIKGDQWREKELDIQVFRDKHEADPAHYHGIRAFRDMVVEFGSDGHYFDDIETLFRILLEKREEILRAMSPLWAQENSQSDWFCDGATKFDQKALVTYSAVVEFARLFPDFPLDLFRVWMKCVNNIVENTDINNYTPTAETAGSLASLLQMVSKKEPRSAKDFIRALAEVPDAAITRAPIREEVTKARRISENDNHAQRWISAFDDVARHPFLKGMIGFYYSENMTIDTFEKHVRLIGSLFDENGIAKPYRAEPHWMLRAIFAQLSEASHLEKRFIVENATEKYLKNFISSSKNDVLRKRMNELFTNGLNGLEAGVDERTSEKIRTAFQNAVGNAVSVPDKEAWDVRETIRIIRSDSDFYKWVFAQKKDIKLYFYHNQYQARGDYERTCIMLPVFRKAQEFADLVGMNYRGIAGSGFDQGHNMFIGEKCLMRKHLMHYPATEVVVNFSANPDDHYPVEIYVAWPTGKLEPAEEKQVVDAIHGKPAFQAGSERQSQIGKWSFSAEIGGEGKITLAELKSRVEELVNTPPFASVPTYPLEPTP